MSLLQTSSVQEYRHQFELLSTPLQGLPTSVLKPTFINGLRLDIQAELHQLEPVGLSRKMRAAQKIEDKKMALRAYHAGEIPRWHKTPALNPLLSHCTMHVPNAPAVPQAVRLPHPSIPTTPPTSPLHYLDNYSPIPPISPTLSKTIKPLDANTKEKGFVLPIR